MLEKRIKLSFSPSGERGGNLTVYYCTSSIASLKPNEIIALNFFFIDVIYAVEQIRCGYGIASNNINANVVNASPFPGVCNNVVIKVYSAV